MRRYAPELFLSLHLYMYLSKSFFLSLTHLSLDPETLGESTAPHQRSSCIAYPSIVIFCFVFFRGYVNVIKRTRDAELAVK